MSRAAMVHKLLDYLAKFPSLDVRTFQLLLLYIRRRVIQEGKVLYARDGGTLYEWAYAKTRVLEDFNHMYCDYREGITIDREMILGKLRELEVYLAELREILSWSFEGCGFPLRQSSISVLLVRD